MKKTSKTSIRVKPTIMQLANQLKQEGYSKSDLFELGVLSVYNNTVSEQTSSEMMCDEMMDFFEKMENKIDLLKNELVYEVQKITEKKSGKYSSSDVEDAIQSIINIIKRREIGQTYGKRVEPLNKEFFVTKASQHQIPLKVLLEELEKRGYTQEYLENIGISPYGDGNNTKVSKMEV